MSSGEAPYRVAHASRCPRCGTPLPTAGSRDAQVCDRGCGEWLSPPAIDEHLCPEALELKAGGAWWKPPPNAPPCATCGQAMQSITTATVSFHRCVDHGLWFDKKTRDDLSRQLADEIQRHRQLRELVELLRRSDEAGLRALARRFLDLELQVAALHRELRGQ